MNSFSYRWRRTGLCLFFLTSLCIPGLTQTCDQYFPFSSSDTSGWNIPSVIDPCSEDLIRTDPYDPINIQNWQRTNTFNWIDPNPEAFSFWEEYCLNSSTIPSTHLKTPFSQDDNSVINHFLTSQDKYPQDGWELIKYDMGFTSAGIPSGASVDYPYLVLYNRFTGILRVFIAFSETNSTFSVAEIALLFGGGGTSQPMSSNLDLSTAFTANQEGITSLTDFVTTPRFVAASRYLDGPGRWLYADFPMMYDPCVCSYGSKMKFEVRLISTAEITMSSISSGVILPDEDILKSSTNTYEDDDSQYSWGWEDIVGFNNDAVQKPAKTYKDMGAFTKSVFDAIEKSGLTFAEKQQKKLDLEDLKDAMELPAFLKDGLKAIPYVSSAITLLDFFVGAGKESSGPQDVIIQPMAIEFNSKFKGTINSSSLKKEITFNTPGGNIISSTSADYPYYNEAMGIFHLKETPELQSSQGIEFITESQTEMVDPFGHNPFKPIDPPLLDPNGNPKVLFKKYSYKLDQDIEYLVNPAAEFTDNSEVMAAFLVVATEPGTNLAAGVGHRDGDLFNLVSEGKGFYRTAFVPLSCINGMTLDFAIDEGSDIQIYLWVLANFERGDIYADASTQNVLWQGRFAVDISNNVANFNDDSPFRGVQENYVFTNGSYFLSDPVSAYNQITIQAGVTLSAGSPVTIRAGENITILPGATISPNITLELGYPNGCGPIEYSPTLPATLSSFCSSSTYNSNDRLTRLSREVENDHENKGSFFSLPLTAQPNPFTDELTLSYELPAEAQVQMQLVDMIGRPVRQILPTSHRKAGQHEIQANLNDLASGMYTVILQVGEMRQTVKVIKR